MERFRRFLERFRPYPELKRAIVNLKTGRAFRGVVWGHKGEYMVLRNAEMLEKNGATSVDGEVLIRRADVEFIQVIF